MISSCQAPQPEYAVTVIVTNLGERSPSESLMLRRGEAEFEKTPPALRVQAQSQRLIRVARDIREGHHIKTLDL